jgi:O-antigen ligase
MDSLVFPYARQITVALLLGIIMGLITLFTGPLVTLSGMMGIILLVMAFTNPEVVILVVLCFASGLIPYRFNSYVSLPVGHAQISDLLLIWLLFVVFFRVFTDKSFPFIKTPLDLPILLFYGAVVVGLGTAVLRFGIDFSEATYEARMLMYYLIFFAITNLIRTRSQLVRLAHGVFAIGLLLAVMMIVQSALGRSIILVEDWMVQGGELVRLYNPGFTSIYVVLISSVSYMALVENEKRSLFRWIQVLVLGAALLATLGRNVLVSGVMGCALLVAILAKPERSRLVRNLLGITLIAILLASVMALAARESLLLNYSTAYLERLKSMLSAGIVGPGENLVPRWEEIRFAWEKISRHPILGIGLTNPYRPSFYPGEPQGLQYFIHNTYISLWLKTGLVGLISFLWLSIVFLRRGFRKWRNVQDDFLRSVVLGFTVAFLGMMLSNIVAPSMVEAGSLAIYGVILGMSESITMQTMVDRENKRVVASREPQNIIIRG